MQIGKGINENFTWDEEFAYSTGMENVKELKVRIFPNKARFLQKCLVWFVAVIVAVMLKITIYNKLKLNSRCLIFLIFIIYY